MAHGKRRRDSIHETPDVSYITNPDVAHEESDVAVRPLLWFVGGLTAFTIVVCVAMLIMFAYFLNREKSQELKASPLARQGGRRSPERAPQPQDEYLAVRDEWTRELNDYGWADEKAGTVRVPVDEAIKRYLQQHPPKPQGAQQQGQTPATGAHEAPKEQTPSDSSSGQQTEQKHQ